MLSFETSRPREERKICFNHDAEKGKKRDRRECARIHMDMTIADPIGHLGFG